MAGDLALSPRETAILQVRVANPSASSRTLSRILDETYDITLSHNRINEILRTLEQRGVFRETILPNRELFDHYLFRIAFHLPNFADRWEETYAFLAEDPHVLMFFTADSDYAWQVVAQFRRRERMERWIHDFFREYGDLVDRFHNTMLHDVHTFRTDAGVFDEMLEETEQGRRYLNTAARRGESLARRNGES